jgi:NAD(P)H-flavin reductase
MATVHDEPVMASYPGQAMVPSPATIMHIHDESSTTRTYSLELDDASLRSRYTFRPGQFNMIYVFGVGEAAISLSGRPDDRRHLIHTVRRCGSVTAALNRMQVGGTVGIRGPFGHGWPLEQCRGRDVILISGGIGLAPIRPAVEQILSERNLYERVILIYGARSPADMLFQSDLAAWDARPDIETLFIVDYPAEGWTGPVGMVTDLVRRVRLRGEKAAVLVCGPRIMNRYVVWLLSRLNVPASHMFVSLERNMRCGVGRCGHCQYGPKFVCKDGPVFSYEAIRSIFGKEEV